MRVDRNISPKVESQNEIEMIDLRDKHELLLSERMPSVKSHIFCLLGEIKTTKEILEVLEQNDAMVSILNKHMDYLTEELEKMDIGISD